ncbi:hypothetical protein P879_07200 [Paragonimus westermani]|uniref:Uncharacterized protein n=1 Tax=Paragonimus westermani TaxID=34504 RepID=A0A8T0DIK2_9TREM|nr:hypothetical protein P879_07200 [Paragonimus westermani]
MSESNVRLHRRYVKKFDVPEFPVLSKSTILDDAGGKNKPGDNNEQLELPSTGRESFKNDEILTRSVANNIPVKSTPMVNKGVGKDIVPPDLVPSLARQPLPVGLPEKIDHQNQTGICLEKYSTSEGKVDVVVQSVKESNLLPTVRDLKSTSVLSHPTINFNEKTDIHRDGCRLTQCLYKIINPIQSLMAKLALSPLFVRNIKDPSYSIASVHKVTQGKSTLLGVVGLTQQSPETDDEHVAMALQKNLYAPILQNRIQY